MIGDRLKALRESRNLTQEQVAKAVGVRKQTVSSWETNKSIPSLQNLLELIKCLKCSSDYLLGVTWPKGTYVETEGLTEEQIGNLNAVIREFSRINRLFPAVHQKVKLSAGQIDSFKT